MRHVFAMILVLTMGPSTWAGTSPRDTSIPEVVRGNTQFALDLYARLRSEQPGNLFFSPASISTALAMTYAGAGGETATEMARVLHFDLPRERLNQAFASLNRSPRAEGYRLSVANRLWGQRGYRFLPSFLDVTRDSYGAELAQVNFAEPDRARREINTWVARATENKITDLIPAGVLDSMSRLVLTNAIYFKGDWTEPFNKRATSDAPFHVTPQKAVQVPLMHRRGNFRLRSGDAMKALELPYGKGDLAMMVILPDAIDGLAELEAKLTPENLGGWLSGLGKQEVRVYLPRFKSTTQIQLASSLKSMGMTRAFSPGDADFSGMDGKRDLFISAVIHEAFVDVNEEGTEAAAATGIAVGATAVPVEHQPVVFRADHPFVFLIRDRRTGSILFLGRETNPAN